MQFAISPRMFQRKPISSHSSGQSLIEVLIATLVVGAIVTAVALALTYSVKNSSQVRYRESGTNLGQEVIEFLRKERARLGWPNFNNSLVAGGVYCLRSVPATLDDLPASAACDEDDDIALSGATFFREVVITKPGGAIRAEVTISWYQNPSEVFEAVLVQEFRESQ